MSCKRQTYLRYFKKKLKNKKWPITIIIPDAYFMRCLDMLSKSKNYTVNIIKQSNEFKYYMANNITEFDEEEWE